MEKYSVFDCTIVELDKHHSDRKGNLSVVENGKTLPFDVKRVYYLYDIPGGESRGAHAHKDLSQLIIAASGSFRVTLDDGKCKRSFFLNRPYQGLYVKPGLWRDLDDFSSGAVCMVLASDIYLAEDYIRDYNEFLEFRENNNMDKYFVLLGGNKLLWGQVCHLRELGYKVIVVAWNDNPDIKGDLFIQMDVKDSEGIVKKLEELGLKDSVYGALSSIDLAAPTVNAINRWCGNKTMPEKFNKVLSKNEMRDAWMNAGLFNRISKMDNEISLDELFENSKKMKLICKPDVSASSRGITILEKGQSKETIQKALDKAKETSFNNKCLIEEFVEGEEFTVDMLGDAYGNVCCYSSSIQHHSKYALNNHITVIHHWNSRKYDDETWVRIANFGIECYKALGLHSMFGHLEIIMKEDGSFTPVEMGARSSGFICSHTVWKASGHDYLEDYIKVLHGDKITPGNYMNGDNASMWFGYDIPSNSHSVKATDITKHLDARITVLYENHEGLRVDEDYGNYINDGDRDKFGYAILCGPRDVLTYESVKESNEKFLDEFLGRK